VEQWEEEQWEEEQWEEDQWERGPDGPVAHCSSAGRGSMNQTHAIPTVYRGFGSSSPGPQTAQRCCCALSAYSTVLCCTAGECTFLDDIVDGAVGTNS